MKTWHSRVTALALAFVATFAIAQPQTQSSVALNIEPLPVGDALNELARQTGLQVVLFADVSEGITTPRVRGNYTTDAALEKLLAGTGLRHEYLNDRTIAVRLAKTADDQAHPTTSADEIQRTLALAQADTSRAETADSSAIDGSDDTASETQREPGGAAAARLEEVVVTATKRKERALDVPLSITAITADEIDRRGLLNAADYLRGVPGVNQTEQFTGQTIVIRGLETSPAAQNFGAGATVATYFGETATTNSAGLVNDTNVDIKLVDIERVEILRGPQGTAFGSSSLGGAVRTIPVAPKLDRFEGKTAFGYSTTAGAGGDNFNIQAVGNLPLVADKLAVRVVAYKFKDSGVYTNTAGTDPVLQSTVILPYGASDDAVSSEEVGTTDVRGARIAALFQATDQLSFTLSYLNQKREMDGFGLANRAGYVQALPLVAPEHAIRGSRETRGDTRIEIANATAEYDLQWADLLATYSYVDSGATRSFPFVGFSFPFPASNIGRSPHNERSGEIRLATKLEGAWDFLVGLYYEKVEDDYTRSDYWHGDPALQPLALFGVGNRFLGQFNDRRERQQKAAFGEVSWEFLPRFTLTGGARFYDHERDYRRTNQGPFYGTTPVVSDTSVSDATFRANLSYKPANDALVYVDWSQGFRLGNPQTGLAPGRCDVNNDGIVDGTTGTTIASTRELLPDSLDSYELGGKFAFLERRVTTVASIFQIEWDEPPFRVIAPLPPAGCGLSYVATASKVRSQGVELQTKFQISPAWSADLGASWLKARLIEDAPNILVAGQPARAGDRLPGAPRFNANVALQYGFAVGSYAAYVRADSIYVGTYYDTIKPLPNFKAGGYLNLDLSARAMVNDNLSVDVYARNVTDEDDFTFRDVLDNGPFFGYRMRPRTVGIQLGYTFD
jgi:iron complex outermembrane recepter protein